MHTNRRDRREVSHSLSMRGAEIALKMTSCRVMLPQC